MHLSSLRLTQFKNYETQQFSFSPRLNCLTGLNGVGKTNVLDAIYYLCLTKSHSGLSDRHLVKHDSDFFRLEAIMEDDNGPVKIVAKYPLGQRREMALNGQEVERLTDYIGEFPVVMIAPDDIELIQDGSEERRRFLDATLSQVSGQYLRHLLIYNALIKQRNALLKQFAEQRRFDDILLDGFDRQLLAPVQTLYESRSRLVTALAPFFQDAYLAISGGRETVELHYENDVEAGNFEEKLLLAREKDRIMQRSTVGPHRDDLKFGMNGQPVKKFASQGQLKSFLLALRLAQYEVLRREKGFAPILLLDDIFDKLDEQRVRQLVGLLIGRDFGQIFITDTQRSRIEEVVASFTGNYKVFEIENGRVARRES